MKSVMAASLGTFLLLAGCIEHHHHYHQAEQPDANSDANSDTSTDPVADAAQSSDSGDAGSESDAGGDANLPQCPQILPAFPEAQGWGAHTVGGRGGRVIYVTNLDDSGPGSLRAAIEASGPRTVVFRVSGYITLESTLYIDEPFLTIAGQTAPGSGITIRQATSAPNRKQMVVIRTNDVIVRNLRFRKGRADDAGCCDDALEFHGPDAKNIVIDRCSFSWSQDGHIDMVRASDVTVQRSLLAEALYEPEAGQDRSGKGMLIYDGERISVHHNMFAHNYSRNPRIDSVTNIEVINNLIYGYRSFGIELGENFNVPLSASVVSNYFRPNADEGARYEILTFDDTPDGSVYVEDNYDDAISHPNYDPDDPWAMVGICLSSAPEGYCRTPAPRELRAQTRFDAAPIAVATTGHEAVPGIVSDVGALPLDAVDQRIIAGFEARTGGNIASEDDVGGYPTLAGGDPYPDDDEDGMDDAWEAAAGLDTDADDSADDADGDGYTNLEEFLNGTDPQFGCQSASGGE